MGELDRRRMSRGTVLDTLHTAMSPEELALHDTLDNAKVRPVASGERARAAMA